MQNRYPLWKYLLMIFMLIFGVIYSLPNLYGEDPAVQISATNTELDTGTVIPKVEQALSTANLPFLSVKKEDDSILVRFANTDVQLQARDLIKSAVGDAYTVALNLASRTPQWLEAIGARPMKLGLDLRGGVHFLLNVDLNTVVKAREDGDINNMLTDLRENKIRYTASTRQSPTGISISFRDEQALNDAYALLRTRFPDYLFGKKAENNVFALMANLSQEALVKLSDYAIEQNLSILTTRVNELGVAEAVIQRQGQDNISVDLPGVQDTARAKDIIGKTATLKFMMVDTEHDLQTALEGAVPLGSRVYQEEDGRPVLLKNQIILRGSSITYASTTTGEDGRPAVNVRLGGGGESLFHRITAENIGKPMAVVYVETKSTKQTVDGKPTVVREQVEKVISVATIQSALGNNFIITGLNSVKYAQNLALLLRSGSFSAPVDFVQERVVGPSLGAANIKSGVVSLIIGTLAVVIFMIIYYHLFGLIADIALILNVIFILAIMSLLGATMTLPGMAGIVLTVGIAVDANVLINERIREELRLGLSPQASIFAGYDRAFSTIVDANVTSLIVAIVLFSLGSSAVKSFAVTLTVGILTSMVTAIFYTRGIVNLIYGGKNIKKLSIGFKNDPASVGINHQA
jgi:preprotein translocase subunit SecD